MSLSNKPENESKTVKNSRTPSQRSITIRMNTYLKIKQLQHDIMLNNGVHISFSDIITNALTDQQILYDLQKAP